MTSHFFLGRWGRIAQEFERVGVIAKIWVLGSLTTFFLFLFSERSMVKLLTYSVLNFFFVRVASKFDDMAKRRFEEKY